MELEAASDEAHVVGEQRRGERVTPEAAQPSAVEGEAERLRAIDPPARR
jgi:hypothetical protein